MATKASSDRHKPRKMVGIPLPIAAALQQCAEEDFNYLSDQVLAACREYLTRRDKLPRPGNKPAPRKPA